MAIDHEKISEAVMGLGLVGAEDNGLLRSFGVILANNPVDYLVNRELEFINVLGESAMPMAEKVLIDAAQWCANATFGGIMGSPEWTGLVQPMIEKPTDRLEGLIAITNVLGWGHISDWDLNEDSQELTFKVQHSYYVKNWINQFGKSERPRCYMWTGVAGGYLDLLHGSKVHEFVGEETECGCVTGGDTCVFTAKKLKKKYSMV